MPIPYKIVSKYNPAKPGDPKKFYASVNSSGEVNIRDLAREIADISTMSLPDVIGVLESLVMLIPKHARQGKIVRLGEVGSLRISASSEGCATEQEVNASKIRGGRFLFTPGKDLQQSLKTLEFVKLPKAG